MSQAGTSAGAGAGSVMVGAVPTEGGEGEEEVVGWVVDAEGPTPSA